MLSKGIQEGAMIGTMGMVYKRGSDRDSGISRGSGRVYKEVIDRDMASRSQAVADKPSTGNITTWPLHLHPPSKLTTP